jgi:hypothetical protein
VPVASVASVASLLGIDSTPKKDELPKIPRRMKQQGLIVRPRLQSSRPFSREKKGPAGTFGGHQVQHYT